MTESLPDSGKVSLLMEGCALWEVFVGRCVVKAPSLPWLEPSAVTREPSSSLRAYSVFLDPVTAGRLDWPWA